jgi:quinoprotein glucose dehydrogenase
MLIDVKQRGRTIPAVAVVGKMGLLFLLDRVTGKPIYGVEERPVAPGEVPLERASKTQPFPLKPAPLSRMSFAMSDIATVTPELEAECRKLLEGVQIGGPYLPPGYNACAWRSQATMAASTGAECHSIRSSATSS